jgi:APA family basic amino acid/polyamine antiporter
MVDLTNVGTLFAFVLVCIGVCVLRFKVPDRPRPFRVPLGPFVLPALGALACLGLIVYLPPTSWLRFFAWLVVGLALYALYGAHHSRLRQRAQA